MPLGTGGGANDVIEASASSLARAHSAMRRPRSGRAARVDALHIERTLEKAVRSLTSGGHHETALGKPAEWFLDNYYLVRRVARQVAEELPRGFVRRLPVLSEGHDAGRPRLFTLARAMVVGKSFEVDASALQYFIECYQRVSPLTIAELWALPTTLRFVALERLVAILGDLGFVGERKKPAEADWALDPATGVERSIRLLRLLADIDWSVFFETNSRASTRTSSADRRPAERSSLQQLQTLPRACRFPPAPWPCPRAAETV